MSNFNSADIAAFKDVWVFCEQREGKLMPTDFELISKGRDLADELGGSMVTTSAQNTMANGRSAEASKKWSVGATAKQRTRTNPVVWPLAAIALILIAWEMGSTIAMSRRLL